MPNPVITQPIVTAAGLATAAIFWGRLNTPAPIIEPITSAVSALRSNLLLKTLPLKMPLKVKKYNERSFLAFFKVAIKVAI